jgi:hypothetical protein
VLARAGVHCRASTSSRSANRAVIDRVGCSTISPGSDPHPASTLGSESAFHRGAPPVLGAFRRRNPSASSSPSRRSVGDEDSGSWRCSKHGWCVSASQKPGATRVAGIYAWNQLGRRVKRGEKGIMILAPMVGRKRNKRQEQSESDAEQADAKSTDQTGSKVQLVGFRPVYVWDVLQTEGKDLPQLDEVTGNPDEQLPRLIEFVQAQGIKLEYSEKIAPARGLS